MMNIHTVNTLRRERGSSLIISLLILIVLTLLGITSMNTSGMEEKMAYNNRDLNLAFEAAEAALRQGEAYVLDNIVSTSAFDGSNPGLYPAVAVDNPPPDYFADATWANSRSYTGTLDKVTTQPKYIVELVDTIGKDDINIGGYGESSGTGSITAFRVTARGTGGTDHAVTYLQSYYGRRF